MDQQDFEFRIAALEARKVGNGTVISDQTKITLGSTLALVGALAWGAWTLADKMDKNAAGFRQEFLSKETAQAEFNAINRRLDEMSGKLESAISKIPR